ncbi:Protein of unknown function [Gryllus bimaculatus]|nr:Protein of unknown function [Gryllus bimaculatus]
MLLWELKCLQLERYLGYKNGQEDFRLILPGTNLRNRSITNSDTVRFLSSLHIKRNDVLFVLLEIIPYGRDVTE